MYSMKEQIKKRVTHRLKILEGQIRGLQKMVQDDSYCIDVLRQSSAAKEALSSVEDLLLENHLSTHVIEQIKAGKKTKPVQEVLTIYKLAKKK